MSERKSIHDGWTPQPHEQEQPRPAVAEPLTPDDLDKLDALAAAATPGPWSWNSYSGIFGQGAAEPLLVAQVPSRVGDTATAQGAIDAAFIAACDPATIRELVAAARRGEELLRALDRVGEWLGAGDVGAAASALRKAQAKFYVEGWDDAMAANDATTYCPTDCIFAHRHEYAALHHEAGTDGGTYRDDAMNYPPEDTRRG